MRRFAVLMEDSLEGFSNFVVVTNVIRDHEVKANAALNRVCCTERRHKLEESASTVARGGAAVPCRARISTASP